MDVSSYGELRFGSIHEVVDVGAYEASLRMLDHAWNKARLGRVVARTGQHANSKPNVAEEISRSSVMKAHSSRSISWQ